jgi:lysyl endopeptidase
MRGDKTMNRTLAVLLLAFAATSALGETRLAVAGKPASAEPKARLVATALKFQGFPAEAAVGLRLKSHTLPRPLETFAGDGEEKRLRVGTRRDVATETEFLSGPSRLAWVASPHGGQVTRLSVTSPQAASLRLGLRIRELPAGAELRFTSPGFPGRVVGPVGAEEAMATARSLGAYWTPLTEGDTQLVEIWVPDGGDPASVRIEVDGASHITAAPSDLFKSTGVGASQSCHEDVSCVAPRNPALAQAARSVAKLVYTENGVTYICSGTLISDGDAASQVPYLYTAAHCIGTQAAAATLNTFWFFEAALCGGKAANDYRQLTGGATLLYANPSGDAALLRLSDRAPEGAWFSGWDGAALEAGASLVALHHPAGDLKKLSLGQALATTSASGGVRYTTAAWTSGSTEGGSSGSGLFTLSNGEYLLRGGLRGGSASCSSTGRLGDPANRDYYSRIDLEAPTLKTWLSTKAAPLEDYTDMWFSPEEPGWGLSIMQNAANRVFAAWFTYDANNQPTWIVLAETSWKTAVALEGTLYRTSGSAFDRPYDAARFTTRSVGTGRIEFGHNDTATLTFMVDGKAVVKAIRRQPI